MTTWFDDALHHAQRYMDLTIPIYLSQSRFSMFDECRMKWAYSVAGWRRRLYSVNYQFGTAVDKGTLEPDADPRIDGKARFHEIWDAEELPDRAGIMQPVEPGDEKGTNSRPNLTIAGENRVEEYKELMDGEKEQGRKVIQIQSDFSIKDPLNPISGKLDEEMQNVLFVGTRDLLEEVPVQALDQLLPVCTDVKTGKLWGKELGQLLYYVLARLYETGEITPLVCNVIMTKSKKPRKGSGVERRWYPHKDKPTPIDDSILTDVYMKYAEVARKIREGRIFRDPRSCHTWGGYCQYHPLCFPEMYEDPDGEVSSDLFNIIDEKGADPDGYYEQLTVNVRGTDD